MKVSVAFITYNHEPFVAQALESALMQEGVEFEIVVGEDCSTDKTREIVSGYAQRDPGRIRILPAEKNLGMHRNTERTLQACTGEYVALLEGDDYWTAKDKIQRQVEHLGRHPGHSLCFHGVDVVHDNLHNPPRPFYDEGSPAVFTVENLAAGNFIPSGSAMFRHRPGFAFPAWLLRMPMVDWGLFVLCAERGDVGYLPDRMGAYRVHGGGIWSSLSRVDVLEKSIRASRILDAHLGGRYRRIMKRSVASWNSEIARILSEGNDKSKAARHALRSLAGDPLGTYISRRDMLAIVARGIPGIPSGKRASGAR